MALHARVTWTLGDRLLKARRLAGLTADELGEELGISRSMISRYENDLAVPRRAVMIVWAQVCGVDYEWLKDGDERPLDDADHGIDMAGRAFRWNVIQFAAAA